jgi:hypothetical protein
VGGGGGTTSTQVEQRVSLRHAAQHTLLALHAKERNGGAPPPSQHTPAVTLTTPPALQLRGGGARVWLGPWVGDARLHTNNGKYSGPAIAAAAAIAGGAAPPARARGGGGGACVQIRYSGNLHTTEVNLLKKASRWRAVT